MVVRSLQCPARWTGCPLGGAPSALPQTGNVALANTSVAVSPTEAARAYMQSWTLKSAATLQCLAAHGRRSGEGSLARQAAK